VATRGSPQRRWLGLLAGLAMVGACTAVLLPARDSVTVATPALVLVAPVIVAGFLGGRFAGVLTATVAAISLDLLFIRPYGTLTIHVVDDVVALVAFGAVAFTVATLVAQATDRRRAAEMRAEQVLTLSREREAILGEQQRLASEKYALEQAESARRSLLRSVSHDLRTPLAAIRAITSDLRSGAAYDEATRDDLLDVVSDEAERLDRLVANLLSLSRIEAQALVPDLQAVDLEEIFTDRVRRLSRVLRDVKVETHVPPGLPLVDADYVLLDQVLTNLLENAARHAPPRSTIRIDACEQGEMMEVSVSDEGDGVPTDEGAQIFEPFRTGGGPQRSSGVGLAICRAIVEAHGGTISVGDARPAGDPPGARFSFTLPLHHARAVGG
jgi:two-component system, OmpR family, sensor histidine kinase KdpD